VTTEAPPIPDGWGTTTAIVAGVLGPTVDFAGDALADLYVDAANRWAHRKRWEAGYVDAAPADPDVVLGCSYYAVALWRERQSVDGFQSFDDFPTGALTGGSAAQIRKLLGIGKARVDSAGVDAEAIVARRRMRRVGWRW
jgi:hypothetical protein